MAKNTIINTLSVLVCDPINIIASIIFLTTMSAKLIFIVFFLFPLVGLIIGNIGKTSKENRLEGKQLLEFYRPSKKTYQG